jgi:predicted nucleic acid-binding protein
MTNITTNQNFLPIYIVDACVIICYVYEEPNFESVDRLLQLGFENKIQLVMSAVNYGEVMQHLYRNKNFEQAKLISRVIRSEFNIEFVDAGLTDADMAGFYKSKGGIAYMDGFILALAKKKNAKILTLDKEFLKYKDEFEIEFL